MDEIGQSSIGINHFIETLQNIMSNIISNSNVLDGVVGNVASSVAASSDNANDISAIMEELSATMEEVSATTNSVSENTLRKAKYRRWQIRPRLCHNMRRI